MTKVYVRYVCRQSVILTPALNFPTSQFIAGGMVAMQFISMPVFPTPPAMNNSQASSITNEYTRFSGGIWFEGLSYDRMHRMKTVLVLKNYYLTNRHNGHICGRFRFYHLSRIVYIRYIKFLRIYIWPWKLCDIVGLHFRGRGLGRRFCSWFSSQSIHIRW